MKSASRLLIATFGSFVGLTGIEHGLGEILQGNTAPAGIMIRSWPDSDFFRILGGEPAMTIVPNLLFTGILAVLISLFFMLWSLRMAGRRHGGLVLMLAAIPMLLFGGGIFPPVLGFLIGAAATRLDASPHWWWDHLSTGFRELLERLWPWTYGACVLAWLAMFPGIPLLNHFFGVSSDSLILTILAGMFAFLLLSGITGAAHDLQARQGL